jgi:response regulator of citrate/malate metabolism
LSGKKPIILIVEDDAIVVRSAKRLIQAHGRFDVMSADTNETAKSCFLEHTQHIVAIFLDGHLGTSTSLEFLALIREMGFKGKVVCITGDSQMRDSMIPSDSEKPTCDEYVAKQRIAEYALSLPPPPI